MALQCYTQSDGKENPMEPRNCSQPHGENLIPVCYLKKITYFPNEFGRYTLTTKESLLKILI